MSNFIAGHEITIQDTGAPRGERNYWRVLLNGQSIYEGHNGAQAQLTYRAVSEGLKRAAPPAAAHGDEAVRIDARLLELYQAPFRFDERGGYIWDAQNNMVADNHVEGDQAMRVRGWGRLSYRKDGDEVQDLMGQAMADALTARWNSAMRAQGDGEVQ